MKPIDNQTNFNYKKISKQLKKKLLSFLLVISVITSFYGCGFSANSIDNTIDSAIQAHETDNEKFSEYTNNLFKDAVTDDTLTLHSYLKNPKNYGITDYNLTLGGYDFDNLDPTKDITDGLNELKTFDRNTLSNKQKIIYDELLQYFNTELEYSDLYMFETNLSQTIGLQVQLPIIFAEYTFSEEKDIIEYLAIISDTDRFMQNLCEYETLRSKQGYFMEDNLADKIIEQCQEFVNNTDNNCLISSFNERLETLSGISDEKKTEYKAQNETAVNEHVIKGYNTLIDTLKSLKGSNKYKGGLCNYPNGDKYYEYILKSDSGWSKSVDEFDKLLDKYIANDLGDARSILLKSPELTDKIESFESDITDPDSILKDLKSHIDDVYPKTPELNWTIKYVPDSLKDYASPAMYFTPQIDNIDINSIYINTGSSDTSNLYTTLAHEGYPGHMYQITYFESSNPDLVRYLIEPGGYVEGWATYAEINSYSYIKSSNPDLNTLCSLNNSITLYMYAKVDIGVNHYGWDCDDVLTYLANWGLDEKEIAQEMYDSMVSEPGNYCKYVLGYLGFMELKNTASEKLGDKFNLKEFHKYVLDYGPVQFDILFNNLDAWVEKMK